MKLEDVDFRKHSCEEFPGKRIVINGVHYQIGKFVGMGGSKIAYELVNIKAGISHHIIKLYFGPDDDAIEAAKYEAWAHAGVKKVAGPSGDLQAPCTFYVASNGGVFQIQEYLFKTPRRVSSPIPEIVSQCEEQLLQDPIRAIELLEKQRLLNPHDTIVLNNLAACCGLKGDWEKAFEYQSLILNIEPHYCPFSYHFIKICGEMELFTTAIQEHNRLRALYPHPHESDEEMLMILLSAGNPEKAQELLDEMFCESEQERARLQETVHHHREAKEKTREVYEVVFDLIRTGKREEGLELIEKAVKIYPQDYLLLANYAFFLRINERYDAAAKLLFWLLRRVFGSSRYAYFLANGIYCYLMSDDPSKAVPYLKSLYEALTAIDADISEMEPWNFPGVALFFLRDGFVVEDSPQMAISALEKAFPYVNPQQRGYLECFCDRLRIAQRDASSGRVSRMLFQE